MQAPQISPDGRYWWDGRAWQPMPSAASPPPVPAADPSRPAWLADGVTMPSPPSMAPPPSAVALAAPASPWAPAQAPAGEVTPYSVFAGTGSLLGAVINELGVVGVIYTLLLVLATITILSTPVGSARYGIPLAGVALVVRRGMQGRWIGAGAITFVWAIGAVAALATGH
jgi:hypothetical protein